MTHSTFTEDGFTTAAASGIDLIIAPETASSEADTTKILTGDGSTLYDDEPGTPLASYQNTSGTDQTVVISIDNGHFNTGTGNTTQAFSSYTARVV